MTCIRTAINTIAKRVCQGVLFALASVVSCSAMSAPDLSEYEVVFSDEFNGQSLDPALWSTAPLWGPYLPTNMEEQFYIDTLGINQGHSYDPFNFTGSSLIISSDRVSEVGAPPAQPSQDAPVWLDYPEYTYNEDYNPNQLGYLSGLISSVNSYNFTHGYVEARVKVPAGRGLWSAFWLLTSKYVEDVPEIDVMEYIGQEPNEVNHTLHYFDVDNNWSLISSPTYKTTGPDYSADFHTYGLLWSPTELIWYVDGEEVKRITDEEFLVAKQSMYIIANLAVGGSWPGSPDASTPFPADYELDYIRAYQKIPPAQITPQTLASDYQLMFSDEFSANTVDEDKWVSHYLWGPYLQINNEEQVYIDALGQHQDYPTTPFEQSNGTLKITADDVEPNNLPLQPDINNALWTLNPQQQFNPDYGNTWTPGYTSGVLTSYESFKFVNGYVEMRAKVPEGAGLWPAFWLLNGYYIGNLPEIDIMEMQGEAPQSVHQTYHYHDNNGELVSSPAVINKQSGTYSDGEFHTFGVQWHPGTIKWYVDGELTRTLNDDAVSTQLMYIIVNLAVGGNFVGPVNTDFPKTLEVDYIRAYQLKQATEAPPVDDFSVTVGDINNGIAVQDNATGQGYILYSETDVASRFSNPSPHPRNAANFIAVRYVNGSWYYNNNRGWYAFSIAPNDVLVAQVNFSAHTVQSLIGTDTVVHGIQAGYLEGNLTITADQWGGVSNFGEYGVSGSGFEPHLNNNTDYRFAGDLGIGIGVVDNAQGTGFLMHSVESVFSRFASVMPHVRNAEHFLAVRFVSGGWQYNNNNRWTNFTPRADDTLVAAVNFTMDTLYELEGKNSIYQGTQLGYASGDISFAVNRWNGVANAGEFGVSGNGFSTNAQSAITTGLGELKNGVAVSDNASGIGFLMYSATGVSSRFGAAIHPNNATHLIAVRYVNGSWQYNNNSKWLQFTPQAGDRLLAEIDFSNSIVTLMEGILGSTQGIDSGYLHGDMHVQPNYWANSANAGEFLIQGTYFSIN